MKELKNDLLTTKYTRIIQEDEFKYNAPHYFEVHDTATNSVLTSVHFQEGPVKEAGVNGVMNEDLIAMVLCRLENFQNSDYRCRENEHAITKLEEALLWLRKRTMGRESRGVEGTHTV